MEDNIIKDIIRTCDSNISKNLWATRISNSSNGDMPRYLISDYRAFGLITGIVRHYVHKHNESKEKPDEDKTHVFYRGQNEDWAVKPSLYRHCNTKEEFELCNQWREAALIAIKEARFDHAAKDREEREALAQHYGLSTAFVDVVDHIQTALWFAHDGLPEENGVGFIDIIAISKNEATIIDLRNKPSEWIRPHVQQAFCFKMKKIVECGVISKKYHILTLVVPRDLLRVWSGYDVIRREYMYPSKDRGLYYWDKAQQRLNEDGLGTRPEERNKKVGKQNFESAKAALGWCDDGGVLV